MVTHEILPFQFIEMSKFIALFAYRKVHKKTGMYKTIQSLIITFKKFFYFQKFNYLEIIASSLAHLGIWTYKILFQVCVYNDGVGSRMENYAKYDELLPLNIKPQDLSLG